MVEPLRRREPAEAKIQICGNDLAVPERQAQPCADIAQTSEAEPEHADQASAVDACPEKRYVAERGSGEHPQHQRGAKADWNPQQHDRLETDGEASCDRGKIE
jgi:hypothetical protein